MNLENSLEPEWMTSSVAMSVVFAVKPDDCDTQQQNTIYDIDAPFFLHEETIIDSTEYLLKL